MNDASASTSGISSPPKSTCLTCGKSFARPEHLRRHLNVHDSDRSFRCETCSKHFARKDALQRHRLTHSDAQQTLLQRGGRACSNCATSKIRCSGESVCKRCRQRSLDCIYPDQAAFVRSTDSTTRDVGNGNETQTFPVSLPDPLPEQTQSVPVYMEGTLYDNGQAFNPSYWHSANPSINWLPTDFPGAMDSSPVFEASIDPFAWYGADFSTHPETSIPAVSMDVNAPLGSNQGHTPASNSITQPVTSPTDSIRTRDTQSQPGEYYVDGEPARLPRVKRRRISTRHAPAKVSNDHLSLAVTWNAPLEGENHITISNRSYEEIIVEFIKLSTASGKQNGHHSADAFTDAESPSILFSMPFEPDMPGKRDLEYLLTLFAKHILPILPVFHHRKLQTGSWQLLAAAIALGSHFVEGGERFGLSIHELIRRMLYVGEEQSQWLPKDNVERLQVKLLHTIGTLYSGNARLQQAGSTSLAQLVRLAEDMMAESGQQAVNGMEGWDGWISSETSRRTWYAIWLLDSIHAYEHRRRPCLKLSHDSPDLPCPDSLWTATDEVEWSQHADRTRHRAVNLLETMERLYINKELPANLCEFGRVLVIHGIFRRTWEVEDYFQQPLSTWTPSASKELDHPLKKRSAIWLPANPVFTKWRNSACDCLDVLHWSANATIGDAAGIEHPTVLHLHLARVILLTPYKHIVSLAHYLAGDRGNMSDTDVSHDKHMIRRWVTQDQYKARLAMIHAGVLFWHVRRFSANAFYEPGAVAFSTLALWAFSAFADRRNISKTSSLANSQSGDRHTSYAADGENADAETEGSEEAVCDIVLLDRPTDDELVQQFVRIGNKMKAYMKGVGDLYGDRGAEKVLLEGRKLLASLTCWSVRERWIRMLDKLIEVTKEQRLRGNGQ